MSIHPQIGIDTVASSAGDRRPYAIYALTDPRETDDIKRIRYVGKGRPLKRYRAHIHCARREGPIRCTLGVRHTHCCNWLRNVLVAGLLPGQRILEWTSPRDGGERERAWIRSLREQGAHLTNLTDGGEGTPGYKQLPETIAKKSAAQKGKKPSPETVAAARLANIGNKYAVGHYFRASEGTKLRMSAARMGNKNNLGHHPSKETLAKMKGNKNALGCKWSSESRAKMMGNKNALGNKNRLGHHASEETKLRMSAAHIGNKNALGSKGRLGQYPSEETLAKMSAAKRGKKLSVETKLKMSAARRAYLARKKALLAEVLV